MGTNKSYGIDFSTLISEDFFDCLDDEVKQWADQYLSEAKEFLLSFHWCRGIKESYLGLVEPTCFGVFLFKLDPVRPDIDKWLWVIVGDVPPAYLVCDRSPSPISAISAYIYEMKRWIQAIENGLPVDKLIPVDGPATKETAEILGRRLNLMRQYIDEIDLDNDD